MHPATPSSTDSSDTSLPIARIDGQDETFVLPLREYLSTHGCTVLFNDSSASRVLYHFIVGDSSYVQAIAAGRQIHPSEKRLVMIIGGTKEDAKGLAAYAKTILVDPVSLSSTSVSTIFSFFFTSRERVLDLRSDQSEVVSRQVSTIASEGVSFQTQLPQKEAPSRRVMVDDERIRNIISDVYEKEKPRKNHGRGKRRVLQTSVRAFAIGFAIVIVLPVVWYLMSLAIAGTALVWKSPTVAVYWLTQSRALLGGMAWPLTSVGLFAPVRSQERVVGFLRDVATLESDGLAALGMAQETAASILSDGDGASRTSPVVLLEKLAVSLASLHSTLALTETELSMLRTDGVFPLSLPQVSDKAAVAIEMMKGVRQSVGTLEQLVRLYPKFAGFREPQTYLLLFQNSMELRPTGGFIGSVGVAKFEEGKLADFAIHDVYALDGQLKGHVDPPGPVRELLAQEHWYLRDSNWDPDFSISGKQAAWFYEKETGQTVDGVIAVSLPFLVDVLRATGPIELADYNDTITAENVYGKALYYTKTDFFPGSTQKKDFLGALARTLILEITTGNRADPAKLFSGIAAALGRHDVQFYFPDTQLAQLVRVLGWAGSMSPLAVVEANVSVNKASLLVHRSYVREIEITPEGEMSEVLTMGLKNTDKEPYTAYFQIIVPEHASVNQVTLDGASVPSRDASKKTVPTLPYRESFSGVASGSGIGVAFQIPAGSEERLVISFTHGAPIVFIDGVAEVPIVMQKQSGMMEGTLTTIVKHPVYWTSSELPPLPYRSVPPPERKQTVLAKQTQLDYNTPMTHDMVVRLQFKK